MQEDSFEINSQEECRPQFPKMPPGDSGASQERCNDADSIEQPQSGNSRSNRVAEEVKSRITLFSDLQILKPETKQRLLQSVFNHELKLARIEVKKNSLLNVLAKVKLICIGLIIFGAPVIIKDWRIAAFSLSGWFLAIFCYPVALSISITVILGPYLIYLRTPKVSREFPKHPSVIVGITLTVGWPIALVLLCVNQFRDTFLTDKISPLSTWQFAIAAGLWGAILLWLLTCIFLFLITLSIIFFERSKKIRCPDSVTVDYLLMALVLLEKYQSEWTDLNFKRGMNLLLEEIALCIERYVPRPLRSGDDGTDTWVKEVTREVATAIRELKKWVLTPKGDSRQNFILKIGYTFVHVVSGEWDSLERVAPDQSWKLPKRRAVTI
jgi:hypothetical protein